MTSPETALIERYLEHARVEKRLAARTVALYALHLQQLADKAAAVPIDLLQVQGIQSHGACSEAFFDPGVFEVTLDQRADQGRLEGGQLSCHYGCSPPAAHATGTALQARMPWNWLRQATGSAPCKGVGESGTQSAKPGGVRQSLRLQHPPGCIFPRTNAH